MQKLEKLLEEYSDSHKNSTNILIHKICVPLIMFSLLGIVKAFPVPASWPLWLDMSHVIILLAFGYYLTFKNWKVLAAVLVQVVPMLIILEILRPRFFLLCLLIFILAWIGQFIGHKIEGKKPSFLKDLQFLLIGPIWTVNNSLAQIGKSLLINNAKEN